MLRYYVFKQKTAYEMRISDWSSDVCSSDLGCGRERHAEDSVLAGRHCGREQYGFADGIDQVERPQQADRQAERRERAEFAVYDIPGCGYAVRQRGHRTGAQQIQKVSQRTTYQAVRDHLGDRTSTRLKSSH